MAWIGSGERRRVFRHCRRGDFCRWCARAMIAATTSSPWGEGQYHHRRQLSPLRPRELALTSAALHRSKASPKTDSSALRSSPIERSRSPPSVLSGPCPKRQTKPRPAASLRRRSDRRRRCCPRRASSLLIRHSSPGSCTGRARPGRSATQAPSTPRSSRSLCRLRCRPCLQEPDRKRTQE